MSEDPTRTFSPPAAPPAAEAPTLPPAPGPGPGPSSAAVVVAIPGYEILEELGRGGMGVVWKARQVGLNRAVALKMIRDAALAGPQDVARFRLEAEAVAKLQHPSIVQIYDIGEADGRPYFSLEYVEGGSLAQRLDGKPLPAREAARLVESLARAMHYAHQRGVVHRDLKPANVLLVGQVSNLTGPAGQVGNLTYEPKITDFGLAKLLGGGSQTQSNAVLGTPSYMAPEQAGGKKKDIGPPADVWALGAVLYELLTGRPPFRAETPLDTILQVVSEEPVPPARLNAQVPRDLEMVCLKCLRKEPGRRYASAEELADDLKRLLDGEPVRVRPMTRGERVVRWVRRHRAAALVLAGVLGTFLFLALLYGLGTLADWLDREDPASGKGRATAESLPVDLDLVPRDAFGFVSIRPADLLRSEAIKDLWQQLGEQMPRAAPRLKQWLAEAEKEFSFERLPRFSSGLERTTLVFLEPWAPPQSGQLLILTTVRPFSQATLEATLLSRLGAEAREHQGKTYYVPAGKQKTIALHRADANTLLVSVGGAADTQLKEYFDRRSAANGEGPLRPALEMAARKNPLVIGLNPDRRMLESWIDNLAPQSEEARPLADMQSLALGLELRPGGRNAEPPHQLELRLTFPDEDRAKQAAAAAPALREPVRRVLKEWPLHEGSAVAAALFGSGEGELPLLMVLSNEAAEALAAGEFRQQGHTVSLSLPLRTDLQAPHQAQLLDWLRDRNDRVVSINNLKQLALAMNSYESAHKRLPPAVVYGKDGKPWHSWRVLLLPYVEQENLFNLYRMDEPWDGPNNRQLLAMMPSVYAPVRGQTKEPHSTFYQVFTGPNTPFEDKKQISIVQLADGASNTILIAEAGEAVPWTKPDDLPYDPEDGLPELGAMFNRRPKAGFHAAFGDGSVFFLEWGKVAEHTLRALITRDGGEKIDWDEVLQKKPLPPGAVFGYKARDKRK